jgi:hypothetical protein
LNDKGFRRAVQVRTIKFLNEVLIPFP